MRVKGIVLEKDSRRCILLAPDGQFHRVPLPPGQPVELGQEITAYKGPNRFFQTILVAASLLVAVVAWQLWGTMVPRAVAYVSLDLNPSIELGLDRKASIVSASGLNKKGNELLSVCPVQKLSLEDGIDKLISHTVAAGYFENETNIVLSTVMVAANSKEITEERLARAIEGSLSKSRVQAEVMVQDVARDFRDEAKSLGLSPGRYLVFKDCESQGVKVTAEYLNEQPIANLERDKGIKITVKKLDQKHPGQGPPKIPPGLERAGNNSPGAKDKENNKDKEHPGQGPAKVPPGLEQVDSSPGAKDKAVNKDKEHPGQGPAKVPPGLEQKGHSPGAKDKDDKKQSERGPSQVPPGQERAGNSPAMKDKENQEHPGQKALQVPPGQEKKISSDNQPKWPGNELLTPNFTERSNPWQAIKNKADRNDQTKKSTGKKP